MEPGLIWVKLLIYICKKKTENLCKCDIVFFVLFASTKLCLKIVPTQSCSGPYFLAFVFSRILQSQIFPNAGKYGPE